MGLGSDVVYDLVDMYQPRNYSHLMFFLLCFFPAYLGEWQLSPPKAKIVIDKW